MKSLEQKLDSIESTPKIDSIAVYFLDYRMSLVKPLCISLHLMMHSPARKDIINLINTINSSKVIDHGMTIAQDRISVTINKVDSLKVLNSILYNSTNDRDPMKH
jgi:hypothetical protein